MSPPEYYESITDDPRFQAAMRRKAGMIILLTAASLVWYFGLLFGAAYYKPLFATILTGNINFGMAFAISQYLFAGIIAIIYARFMKKMDATMHALMAQCAK